MLKLIIFRHGEYEFTGGSLIEDGISQVETTSKLLRELLANNSVTVLCSKKPRARESADIVGRILGVEPSDHECLYPIGTRQHEVCEEAVAVLQLLDQQDADIVILVTHKEYAEFLPGFFARERLEFDFPNIKCRKGQAVIIDCNEKNLRLAP
ncbi:hypothetical protein CMO96_02085 [Candidatus Woesebacteria bacterium]|nr:hypothetical protein [Candidatus Woesebacteria bacterium]|tara:strand:+ start:85 stop:543 length:459 start_codon:yes stop_codon:yes gene_type:complete